MYILAVTSLFYLLSDILHNLFTSLVRTLGTA